MLNFSQDEEHLLIHTRTPIYCSSFDLQFQNYTIKQLKDYFGGYFVSDNGTNRYFQNDIKPSCPAERGCYAANFRLSNYFSGLSLLIGNFKQDQKQEYAMELFGMASSGALLSNISTTYITSIIENYFRQLYIALLKYSEKKDKIITSAKINTYDLFAISEKRMSVEEAVALSKSFQNIYKIDYYFREIDSKIDIKGVLSKPYRNRNERLFQTLNRLLEHRHSLVHRLTVDTQYKQEDITKDIKSIQVALDKVYKHICEVYNW